MALAGRVSLISRLPYSVLVRCIMSFRSPHNLNVTLFLFILMVVPRVQTTVVLGPAKTGVGISYLISRSYSFHSVKSEP